MAAIVRGPVLLRLRKSVIPQLSRNIRLISTSKKNSETSHLGIPSLSELAKTEKDFSKPDPDNWLSYGFDVDSKENDRNYHHSAFFFSVTLCLVVGGFGWAYLPDVSLRHWAAREACLELRRREAEGLPLIDKNLIDPAKVVLPTDEELGDTEIII